VPTIAGRSTEAGAQIVCAIHQPNFFPWLGYFDKIRRADVFVFLDDVDYPRKGSGGMGSWTNRVKIAVQGSEKWVGCPIRRFSGSRHIKDVQIADAPWRETMLRTLEMNYARAANFARALDVLAPLIRYEDDCLAEFNINAIMALSAALGIGGTRFVRQSELPVEGAATALLISLVRATGASGYMCGGGASGYQDDAMFAEQGVDLIYQNFTPRPYGDPKSFMPGLSVIDFLMRESDWTAF
jgi:hypothetical protein